MNKTNAKIRKAQKFVLDASARAAKDFALAGGTALELYYLHHRFSADLDFFSPKYSVPEIGRILESIRKYVDKRIALESEFMAPNKAKVRFYTIPVKGIKRPLKLDFVEDIIFDKPVIKKIGGIRVYSAENIYFQKIIAVTGTAPTVDNVGRPIMEGRGEARDIYDIYMLSKKIKPLRVFLQTLPRQFQRGIIHWYRTFSRQDVKLALLDMDIYDTRFNSTEMIGYLENEIKEFTKKVFK